MGYKGPKGRNISNKNLNEIYNFINNFQPKSEVEERNLIILKYAYIDNLSAESIYKLKNPKLISISNHDKDEFLSAGSIRRVIKSYDLVYEKTDTTTNNVKKRNKSYSSFKKEKEYRPKICACCGTRNNLNLHHIIPFSIGGTNEYYNLVYLCEDCHKKIHKMMNENLKLPRKKMIPINTIELENKCTYPMRLIELLEKNKNKYFTDGKRIANYDKSFISDIEDIIKNYNFLAFHFTKIADENDFFKYGICNFSSSNILKNILLKNIVAYYNPECFCKIGSLIYKNLKDNCVCYTYTRYDVINDKSLQGTLTEYYGGEELLRILNNNNIDTEKLKLIGKPAYITFLLNYNNNDIWLAEKLADSYYAQKFTSFKFDGYESFIRDSIRPDQILEITYLNI